MSSAATRSSSQSLSERRTLGYYVEEVVSFDEKLFVTAGVRRDAANAFGKNTRSVYYPKFGASWVISDQSFFHKPEFITSLRLRGTYVITEHAPGDWGIVHEHFSAPDPDPYGMGDWLPK